MEFKNRLENLRRVRGLSQQDLARLAGTSLRTYSRWEAGEQEPRLTELRKLAAALDITTAELIEEEIQDRVTLRHGALSLDIPTTPEGLAFLEKKLSEFTAAEKLPVASSLAG